MLMMKRMGSLSPRARGVVVWVFRPGWSGTVAHGEIYPALTVAIVSFGNFWL